MASTRFCAASHDIDRARSWLRSAHLAGIEPAQKILDWLDSQATLLKR